MNERTKQFRVGVVVFATIVISSILILWNSDFSALPFQGRYQVSMVVDQAPGVMPGTPVRRHGLLIGRVESVEDTREGARITLAIDEGKEIRTNEIARIRSSLVGDAIIEIVKVRPDAPPAAAPADGPGAVADPSAQAAQFAVSFVQAAPSGEPAIVPPGGTIEGVYVPNPLDMLGDIQADLKQSVIALGAAGEEVAELAQRINDVLGESDLARVKRLVESTDRAMNEFAAVTRNLNDIVGDEAFKTQLKEGLGQLPSLVADARAILEGLERAVSSADENLKNLQGLTGPLGDRGQAIVATLEQSIRNLEELLGQVALLTRNVNQSEGTLGLLIRERKTYDQLQQTLAQANAAIVDVRALVNNQYLRMRLEQILDNVRVITDKLARDPARLARGIFDRETPIK
ncbi:MAG: hypothetical protein DCC67_13835 [Planctomycetota bacterium]|nr:MAG: hypothetical protein DCC67_13835 [Planctomycetota bacterium]